MMSQAGGCVSCAMTQQQLESYLWGAAVILRGLVDAGDYKQFVFPLIFFKRLSDVWDEDHAAALAESKGDAAYATATANDRFVIPDGAHWKDVRAAAKDVGKQLQAALRAIEAANPGRLDGIFGDAPWTNKERLPDVTLKNLLEHFSGHTLSIANVPEDELGNGYEFLIKKFADDSGHTAQEFYTNRTVVHLMVQMLEPKPGESIYDPTCGTGGMLISALAEVKRKRGEHRTLKLFGQERNHMTASIRWFLYRRPSSPRRACCSTSQWMWSKMCCPVSERLSSARVISDQILSHGRPTCLRKYRRSGPSRSENSLAFQPVLPMSSDRCTARTVIV